MTRENRTEEIDYKNRQQEYSGNIKKLIDLLTKNFEKQTKKQSQNMAGALRVISETAPQIQDNTILLKELEFQIALTKPEYNFDTFTDNIEIISIL